MNVCICGNICCQTGGIEVSSCLYCVYLDFMGVKIDHTVGVQSKDFFQNAYLRVTSTENIGHN